MNRLQEKRLIKKCLKQDPLAQRMLYEQYKTAMYSIAFRITNDYDLAHDALQDSFIKVFNGLGNYRAIGTLGSWIKTIVIRTSLRAVSSLHLHLEIDEQAIDSHVEFDDSLTGELLDRLMRTLPDKCRVVFNLVEVEGFAHKEVAEMMGIKVGTSKSQLNYAKKILKEKLKNRGYERQKEG